MTLVVGKCFLYNTSTRPLEIPDYEKLRYKKDELSDYLKS